MKNMELCYLQYMFDNKYKLFKISFIKTSLNRSFMNEKSNLSQLILHESYLERIGRSFISNSFFSVTIEEIQLSVAKENKPEFSIGAGTFLLKKLKQI